MLPYFSIANLLFAFLNVFKASFITSFSIPNSLHIIIAAHTLDTICFPYKDISKNEDINFSYRYSRFKENKEIITSVTFKLKKGNAKEIKEKMDDLNGRRAEKQPLNMPSGGSTFKRGNGFITSQIIDEAGLKGYTIGGAQVSTKHAGFVVNTGNATAEDVLNLVDHIIKVVYEKFGKILEPEIEVIGE